MLKKYFKGEYNLEEDILKDLKKKRKKNETEINDKKSIFLDFKFR
jgi:hypothetical protein